MFGTDDYTDALGKAFFGGVCRSTLGLRVGITEWSRDDLYTARNVAHELGHNLGMNHDFTTSKTNYRTDSEGNLCKDYIMGYSFMPTEWSGCSRDDFLAHYNKFNNFYLDPAGEF